MLYLIASEAPNGRHLASDINEVIWGSIAFFVIVGIIAKLAGPAIMRGLRGRTERIEAELADARAERDAAEAALSASGSELPDLGVEEARIRADAAETATRLKADLIAKAQAEADDVRSRGSSEVENFRRQAIADLTEEVAQLTRDSAEAVVVETLDASAHGELIENYIGDLERA